MEYLIQHLRVGEKILSVLSNFLSKCKHLNPESCAGDFSRSRWHFLSDGSEHDCLNKTTDVSVYPHLLPFVLTDSLFLSALMFESRFQAHLQM